MVKIGKMVPNATIVKELVKEANLSMLSYSSMLDFGVPKFLFKCEECHLIASVEVKDEDEIKKMRADKLTLECPCGGTCRALRD
jgi:hypothetical protein